jgi:hypothetical protein
MLFSAHAAHVGAVILDLGPGPIVCLLERTGMVNSSHCTAPPPAPAPAPHTGPKTVRSGYSKRYSKALEYEYKVKIAALGIIKRYSIISLTLYMAWYNTYSIHREGPTAGAQHTRELPEAVSEWAVAAPLAKQRKKCYNSQTKNPN